ncbi:MAG: DUF4139 domain-containing protein [Fimbriiglobus sp.]|jgi:hypothetical protein|nr:DUF4139 domain-containing protein [Fimbriiglobus sp.]
MRLRQLLWAAPVVGAAGVGFLANSLVPVADAANKAEGDPKQAVSLPIKQVVLFNSGVGYFGRTGDVEGESRVDLSFPETDINDLLKSMTLQDFNNGIISAVSYDSREPVARTLSSYAINLNNQPSLADILRQARGEQVEVVLNTTVTTQPGTIKGTVVGTELQKVPVGTAQLDCTVLNVSTAEGLRSVKMMDVQRVRFLNPTLEAELKRALDTLALSHDTQKKAVSIQFSGEGKRKVKVGYVIEAPVWKTSYRLVLDKDEKPYLQGWAIVENPTDEDWSGVKMALVSGRPISFKMDLYNPLYVQRPTVEPELFASLRPPAYDGGFRGKDGVALAAKPAAPPTPTMAPGGSGGFGGGGGGRGGLGGPGGGPAFDAPADAKKNARAMRDSIDRAADKEFAAEFAKEMDQKLALGGSVQSSATAAKLGDSFQYGIKHPVSLARQKSALLPIIGEDIAGDRVSIFNPAVQAKHPLLGFRLKNTTKATLPQGPITVIDQSVYAGDSRIQDTSAGDERLLAYAIDLGTEVIPQTGPGSSRITNVKAVKGIVQITRRQREERVYKIANKSDTDRTLLIEHPNRTNEQFKLVDTAKAVEETAALWRFETKVAAKQSAEFKVTEERDQGEQIFLSNSPDDTIRYVINLNESSAKLKEQLKAALGKKGEWDTARRELAQVQADLARITADQDRIRKNLRETPEAAEVYKKYLTKLSDQEKELDALTDKQKKLMADEFKARKGYEDFLANLTSE